MTYRLCLSKISFFPVPQEETRIDHLVLSLRNVIQTQGVRLLACTKKVSGLSTMLPKAQTSRLKLEIKTEDMRHTCLNRAVLTPSY